MEIYARQGDLVIRQDKFPKSFKGEERAGHVVAGSGTSSHVVTGKALVEVVGEEHRIRVAEDTVLFHAERHTLDPDGGSAGGTPLPAGDYTISPLRERHGQSDRAVED